MDQGGGHSQWDWYEQSHRSGKMWSHAGRVEVAWLAGAWDTHLHRAWDTHLHRAWDTSAGPGAGGERLRGTPRDDSHGCQQGCDMTSL